MVDLTVLDLVEIGVPPYSARQLSQSLQPIQQSFNQRRTVNGNLKNLSPAQFKKYTTTITGGDQLPPALDSVFPGDTLTVKSATELGVLGELTATDSTEGSLGRTPVAGSIRYEGGFTFYRPQLTMMVTAFNINRNEWGAVVDWQLTLEEV